MNESFALKGIVHLLPILAAASFALVLLFVSALSGKDSEVAPEKSRLGPLAVFAVASIFVLTLIIYHALPDGGVTVGGMLIVDRFSLFLDFLLLISAFFGSLLGDAYLEKIKIPRSDFYPMLLLALCGMMISVHAGDLVMMAIGIETMSLAIYALVGCWPQRAKSGEGALKYFVMGAFSSAMFLYGAALIYGATGSTNLAAIMVSAKSLGGTPLLTVGLFLLIVALAFKIAVFPFHMWAPDAYEGAPAPVTAFMAAAVKVAGLGVMARIVLGVFQDGQWAQGATGWTRLLWVLSAMSMIVGTLSALRQDNIKRMLAYSSISHAGYLLIGIMAAGNDSRHLHALLFYLLTYVVSSLGAFSAIIFLSPDGAEREQLEDWRGIGKRNPTSSLALAISLFSLGGMPPTSGFLGKVLLFAGALSSAEMVSLVVIGALASVVSMYYYLRPIVAIYFEDQQQIQFQQSGTNSVGLVAMVMISALGTLAIGLYPNQLVSLASGALL